MVKRIERVTAPALAERLAEKESLFVLDVRTEQEWETGHIEGSVNFPLQHLRERLGEIPCGREIVVHCASGYPSAIAASLLQLGGFSQAMDLVGGMGAWDASRLETVLVAGEH